MDIIKSIALTFRFIYLPSLQLKNYPGGTMQPGSTYGLNIINLKVWRYRQFIGSCNHIFYRKLKNFNIRYFKLFFLLHFLISYSLNLSKNTLLQNRQNSATCHRHSSLLPDLPEVENAAQHPR